MSGTGLREAPICHLASRLLSARCPCPCMLTDTHAPCRFPRTRSCSLSPAAWSAGTSYRSSTCATTTAWRPAFASTRTSRPAHSARSPCATSVSASRSRTGAPHASLFKVMCLQVVPSAEQLFQTLAPDQVETAAPKRPFACASCSVALHRPKRASKE